MADSAYEIHYSHDADPADEAQHTEYRVLASSTDEGGTTNDDVLLMWTRIVSGELRPLSERTSSGRGEYYRGNIDYRLVRVDRTTVAKHLQKKAAAT